MRSRIRRRVQVLVIGLIFALACVGCGKIKALIGREQPPPGESKVETQSKPKKERKTAPEKGMSFFVHTVQYHGETVSIISSWYTKDIMNWKVLAEVNPGVDVMDISVGDRIRIPEDLIKTHEPMRKEYVDSFYDQEPVEAVPSQPEDEPPLYGPK